MGYDPKEKLREALRRRDRSLIETPDEERAAIMEAYRDGKISFEEATAKVRQLDGVQI